MAQKTTQSQATKRPRRGRGFSAMGSLIGTQIRSAGEKRGFATMRLLTHWVEIVGEDIAKIARPVNVTYGRQGFGATLTILTTGAQAPILQTQLPQIREKVNSCYGYSAISRVKITQTAPTGFHEGQVAFEAKPEAPAKEIPAEIKQAAQDVAADIENDSLKQALTALGQNVLTRKTN